MDTTYDTLSRNQVLNMLAGLGIWHDALICHRDGSFTIRCGYAGSSIMTEANLAKLTRYTKAHVIQRHHAAAARDPHIDVRFAFIAE